MSVVARREEQDVTVFFGRADELRAFLVAEVAAGRLTPGGWLGEGRVDGVHWARVRLLPARPRRRVRRGVAVTGVVSVVAMLAAVGWLVAVALAWVTAHVWQIAAVVAVAVLVWLRLRHR